MGFEGGHGTMLVVGEERTESIFSLFQRNFSLQSAKFLLRTSRYDSIISLSQSV